MVEPVIPPVNEPYCSNNPIFCAIKKQANELETLLTIQQAITSRLELSDVLQMIVDEARRLTAANLSILYALEDDDLRLVAVSGSIRAKERIGVRVPVAKSAAGKSIQTCQPIIRTDVHENDVRVDREAMGLPGIVGCYITVPLILGVRPIGVIAVADEDRTHLGPDSMRVLSMLAPSAVIGIENARMYHEQQERRLEAEGRHQMAESLRVMLAIVNSNRSLDEILDYIVKHVSTRLFDCQATAVYAQDPRSGLLNIQSSYGFSINALPAQYLPGHAAASQAVQTGQPVAVTGVDPTDFSDSANMEGNEAEWSMLSQLTVLYQAWLAVPLFVMGNIYGAILLYYREPRVFSEEEINLALIFSDQVALAIENARLRMQAEQLAVIGERNRLARELHDAVSQTLFSANLIAEVLPRLWKQDPEYAQERLGDLRQLTRGALAEMRTLLFELRPSAFKEARLGELLKHLTQGISARSEIPITLTVEGERVLPPDVLIALYRITQEALNNMVKHANATQASVTLNYLPDQVTLIICDDGCGFNPQDISSEHLGLGIMRERAAAINASLQLNSKPGCGTQIEVIWLEATSKEQL